jgi:hypothetical protein
MNGFNKFVKNEFIQFMNKHELAEGSISDGVGNKALVKRDKHGFYKIRLVSESTSRGTEDKE